MGRPELLSDGQGQIAWRARLRAFDRQVHLDRIGGYALGFPGQYHDEETGLAYNVFRDYDPATGRYIQSDPIGLAGGLNTYAYALSNPVSFFDSLGLVAASGAMAYCLEQIFGQSVAGVRIRSKQFVRNNFVTTRKNSIRLPPSLSVDEFFARPHLVLHEYYHVLAQWNTGEMTRRSYLAEVARSGSWAEGNKYEDAADAFADSNFAAFQDCLDKAKACN
ncbi:MAG: RHS repeat-associated core domain-containing protein [Xanthomonadales bacterium]|nr:RHS repeat-associated core domain-containing protein [Xanthomonadales bacterium]